MLKRTLTITTALALLALLIPVAAGAKVPHSFFGASAENPTDRDFQRMEKTGFGMQRFDLNWRAIQKTRKGGYDWGYVDLRMAQSAKVGMRTALIFIGTPRFVRKSPDGFFPPTDSKENRQAWSDFVTAAVKRYGPDGHFWDEHPELSPTPVREWLLWNEQNARPFWRPKPNARDYASLLKITDRAISAIDPKADLVLGGMYCCPRDQRSISATSFIKRLYAVKGIEKHFEAIALHPYGPGVGSVRKQVQQARNAVRKAHDPKVGIVIGELGWASSGSHKSDQVVGARGQASRLSKGLKMLIAKRNAWNVQNVFIYLWRDPTNETPCLWCPGAGLVEVDGTAKPALNAVRKVIKAAT
jgi:hypothetical protein